MRERNKAVMFALYTDVHDLALAQAAYFADHATFAGDAGLLAYRASRGSTVRVTLGTDTSWSAAATHPRTARTCTITYAHPRNATEEQMVNARVEAWKNYDCPR
jgi:hypothetical protein